MSQRDDEEILYECDCFRIVRFVDDEGSANVSISFFDHGVDLYLSDDSLNGLVSEVGYVPLPAERIDATRSAWESATD